MPRSTGRSARDGRLPPMDIKAVPMTADGTRVSLLTDAERRELVAIAVPVDVRAGATLYRQGDRADAVYGLAQGVVKALRRNGASKRTVTAFLFPHDLIGLSEAGRYVNSVLAVTPATLYRMPIAALEHLLRHNAELEYHFLCKVCHGLREAQRHAVVLGRKSAATRVAMFLAMLERREDGSAGRIHLAMTRSDIAGYVALSLESVSRTFRALERDGIIAVRDRHHVRVLDRKRFDRLVSGA
ncbi:MAG TPA: Crp/Fnr family transcriptional regulator [Candidatus Sulfotelmatobacter sp.]|nr:Crp/Fnr family transcriptional regulator [Candidatus Sulfotelmatobacter sp.]